MAGRWPVIRAQTTSDLRPIYVRPTSACDHGTRLQLWQLWTADLAVIGELDFATR